MKRKKNLSTQTRKFNRDRVESGLFFKFLRSLHCFHAVKSENFHTFDMSAKPLCFLRKNNVFKKDGVKAHDVLEKSGNEKASEGEEAENDRCELHVRKNTAENLNCKKNHNQLENSSPVIWTGRR